MHWIICSYLVFLLLIYHCKWFTPSTFKPFIVAVMVLVFAQSLIERRFWADFCGFSESSSFLPKYKYLHISQIREYIFPPTETVREWRVWLHDLSKVFSSYPSVNNANSFVLTHLKSEVGNMNKDKWLIHQYFSTTKTKIRRITKLQKLGLFSMKSDETEYIYIHILGFCFFSTLNCDDKINPQNPLDWMNSSFHYLLVGVRELKAHQRYFPFVSPFFMNLNL